jgi:hypothetical protein
MCGHFRNGAAQKSELWQRYVNSLLISPVKRTADEIAVLADELYAKSFYYVRGE